MAMTRDRLTAYLDSRLEINAVPDASCNGLQVEGSARVSRAALAVDACLDAYREAVRSRCEMLIVHHGLVWEGIRAIRGYYRRHVGFLVENNLNLYAAHLPLDIHPELGHNALIAATLGLSAPEPFGDYHGRAIGRRGVLPKPMTIEQLRRTVEKASGGPSAMLAAGKKQVRTVGIVSGNGGSILAQAAAAGLDCFITGEKVYSHYQHARDTGLNVLYLGHYHSERFGLHALGNDLSAKLGLETVFVDVPPPLPL